MIKKKIDAITEDTKAEETKAEETVAEETVEKAISEVLEPVVVNRAEFCSYKLDDSEYRKAQEVRRLFSEHLDKLEQIIGTTGRELAIAKTKLEEACMFSVRAVVKNAVHTGTATQV